jgi:hypothetical protein
MGMNRNGAERVRLLKTWIERRSAGLSCVLMLPISFIIINANSLIQTMANCAQPVYHCAPDPFQLVESPIQKTAGKEDITELFAL